MVVLAVAAGCGHATPATTTRVASLELRGVHNVSARSLEKGLASRPPAAFEELKLERDLIRVLRFYQSNGYYAARVVLARGTPRQDAREVDVVIAVEEGPPTRIGDVRVYGTDTLDEQTRASIGQHQLGLRRGQVFHHADYVQFTQTLLRELIKRGYRAAKVDGDVEISRSRNLAYVTLRLHP
jgi:outer membrane protein assembly factor BamA